MITVYKIVTATDTRHLEDQMRELIKQGFQPHGELIIGHMSTYTRYTQVAVKMEDKPQ